MNLGKAIAERLRTYKDANTNSKFGDELKLQWTNPKVIAIYLGRDDYVSVLSDSNNVGLQVQSDGWRFNGIRLYQVATRNHFEIGVKFE